MQCVDHFVTVVFLLGNSVGALVVPGSKQACTCSCGLGFACVVLKGFNVRRV
jgi:hypothetical protein